MTKWEICEHCVVFWDGIIGGAYAHMAGYCGEAKFPLKMLDECPKGYFLEKNKNALEILKKPVWME